MCRQMSKLDRFFQKLKHYPFSEKMLICRSYALNLMQYDHLEILENMKTSPLPWELEAFAELSILSEEEPSTHSLWKDQSIFNDIVNYARNYMHPYLKSKIGTEEFANEYIMVVSMLQFKAQENIIDRLFRYDFFWNYSCNELDMSSVFKKKFDGLEYDDFEKLAFLIYFFHQKEFYKASPETCREIFLFLASKYHACIEQLKFKRSEFISMQNEKNHGDINNAIYGFNYLFSYPFIEDGKLTYLPLPYLLIDAVTESLLTRATFDDSRLREKIGKYVAQSYIETILKSKRMYDEVVPEIKYSIGKNTIDSPDVQVRKQDYFCFIDTKLSTPKLSLRQFCNEDEITTIDRYASNICQLYNRINEFVDEKFYPFFEHVSIARDKIWGIVVLLEYPFISKRKIYERVFEKLGIPEDSSEASFIKTNIKLTDFRDIEKIAFPSYDLFTVLVDDQQQKANWANYALYSETLFKDQSPHRIPLVEQFFEKINTVIEKTTYEMQQNGILQ